jgi:hypothetical protein
MPAQKKTSLGLNQWIGSEYPKRIDFVEDNKIIDDELIKRVKYTDVATETKEGIARIHSLDTVENQSNELQNMVAKNLQSQISDFIKTLNNDEILTAKSLVKYLSKLLKPATENTFGLIDFQTIKQVSPKPDLSPYIPFSKGYKNNNNADWVIRANNTDCWAPRHLCMYLENGDYMGVYHLNGGRAYYKVPNRNGGGWNEIMDNHDMAVRDNRMNAIDGNVNAARGRADDAWNRTQDLYNLRNGDNNDKWINYIREIRLAGYAVRDLGSANNAGEINGYVVTGLINHDGHDVGGGDYLQIRALQFYRNGNWVNAYFA